MFPLIETAIAFAAAMLAASLFVSAVVQAVQSVGRYRARTLQGLLRSVIHGFRSYYNDPDVADADQATLPEPKLAEKRALVSLTEQTFVQDVLSDPSLHARADGIQYSEDPALLGKLIEYIGEDDLIDIAYNHAESSAPSTKNTVPSSPPPALTSTGQLPILSTRNPRLPLPEEWVGKDKAYATVGNFTAYVRRWFKTMEASASESFKGRIRRLTLVLACTVVVLFNIDGLHLAAGLYRNSGDRNTYSRRVAELNQEAVRLGAVPPVAPADANAKPVLLTEVGSLLSALDDPSLGLGWQDSTIVKEWCAYRGSCSKVLPAISTGQVASATFSWLLGLIFSCVMLSLGAPFWYRTLSGLINLKNDVSAANKEATKPNPAPAVAAGEGGSGKAS